MAKKPTGDVEYQCSWCRGVRIGGTWYEHDEILPGASHGMCPRCAEEMRKKWGLDEETGPAKNPTNKPVGTRLASICDNHLKTGWLALHMTGTDWYSIIYNDDYTKPIRDDYKGLDLLAAAWKDITKQYAKACRWAAQKRNVLKARWTIQTEEPVVAQIWDENLYGMGSITFVCMDIGPGIGEGIWKAVFDDWAEVEDQASIEYKTVRGMARAIQAQAGLYAELGPELMAGNS